MKKIISLIFLLAGCGDLDNSITPEQNANEIDGNVCTYGPKIDAKLEYIGSHNLEDFYSEKRFKVDFKVSSAGKKDFNLSATLNEKCKTLFEKLVTITASMEEIQHGTCSPISIIPDVFGGECSYLNGWY